MDFYPPEEILGEVQVSLAALEPDEIDYITVVGQGEPLLCASLGVVIREVQAVTGIPVAVEVREELRVADVVMPTLDAADEETFRKINRPWPTLRVDRIVDGMAAFREVFDGQLWIEVMLVRGINDTEPVLLELASALERVRPDRVHINVPIRPPAEDWVEPPDNEGMMRSVGILGEVAPIVTPAEGDFVLADDMPVTDAVIEIIRRHPMREQELLSTLQRFAPGRVRSALEDLEASELARKHTYRSQVFWEYSGGRFGARRRDSGDAGS
jgi:wyosine [tRNA(Phe)-imidazoG37] synthetase (radical SAM superfamily)